MMGWVLLLDANYGLLNVLARKLPLVTGPIFSIYSVPGIMWVHLSLTTVPIMVILLTPALRQLDTSYEEAAEIAGATAWTVWRKVTLPLLAAGDHHRLHRRPHPQPRNLRGRAAHRRTGQHLRLCDAHLRVDQPRAAAVPAGAGPEHALPGDPAAARRPVPALSAPRRLAPDAHRQGRAPQGAPARLGLARQHPAHRLCGVHHPAAACGADRRLVQQAVRLLLHRAAMDDIALERNSHRGQLPRGRRQFAQSRLCGGPHRRRAVRPGRLADRAFAPVVARDRELPGLVAVGDSGHSCSASRC